MCKPVRTPYKVKIKPEWVRVIRNAIKRAKTVTINRDYDIPYLAGYSKDGKIVYIDRDMPEFFKIGNRKIPTDRFLAIHECVEKDLIDHFGLPYFNGIGAHKIATDNEFRSVLDAGVPLKPYNDFMDKHAKEAGHEKVTSVPPDLDLTPYEDEHDKKILMELKKAHH